MKRDQYIDGVKTIALILVFALHTQRSLNTGICYNPVLYYSARCCMPLFFMVNGSLILRKSVFEKEYFIQKAKKIFRLLVLWGGVLFFYSLIVKENSFRDSVLNGIKGALAHYVIPFWFLYTFILIYLLLLFFFNIIRNNEKIILITLLLICIAFDLISLISIINGGYFIQARVPQFIRLWTWLLYFVLGHYLSAVDINKLLKWKKFIFLSAVILTIVCVVYQNLLCNYYLNKINSEYCYDNLLLVLWSTLIFLSIRILENKSVITLLGKVTPYSFGAFLLHPLLLDAFALTEKVTNGFQSTVLWIALVFVCWILSYLLSKLPYINKLFRY